MKKHSEDGIQIELNQKWERRNGTICEITQVSENHIYPYVSDDLKSYTSFRREFIFEQSPFDLIKLIKE